MLARFWAVASRAAPPRLRQFLHFFSLSPRCFLCFPHERFRPHIQYSCGFAQCGLGMETAVPVPLVRQIAQVDAVVQQLVQVLLVDARAAAGLSLLRRPGLGDVSTLNRTHG